MGAIIRKRNKDKNLAKYVCLIVIIKFYTTLLFWTIHNYYERAYLGLSLAAEFFHCFLSAIITFMLDEKLNRRIEQFNKALVTLEEAVNLDNDDSNIIKDSTIQRFEYTLEMGWKLLRCVLIDLQVDLAIDSPKTVVKTAFESKVITDGDGWANALKDRNSMSHIYSSDDSAVIYERIKRIYVDDFRQLRKWVNDNYQ